MVREQIESVPNCDKVEQCKTKSKFPIIICIVVFLVIGIGVGTSVFFYKDSNEKMSNDDFKNDNSKIVKYESNEKNNNIKNESQNIMPDVQVENSIGKTVEENVSTEENEEAAAELTMNMTTLNGRIDDLDYNSQTAYQQLGVEISEYLPNALEELQKNPTQKKVDEITAKYREYNKRVQEIAIANGIILDDMQYSSFEDSEYVISYSDKRYLTEADLSYLTPEQLRVARNEIYARHGRTFSDESLQSYFNSCSWYRGTVSPDNFNEEVFNEYEKANRDFIVKYEEERGYNK